MNNGTKSANIMTWSKYKKLFSPKLMERKDSTFGTKSIIEPTMRAAGFTTKTVYDVNEEIKPIDIVKDSLDVYSKTYVVYQTFIYRDKSGKGIFIFYI